MHLKPHLKLRKIGSKHMIVDTCADSTDLTNVFTLNASAAWIWQKLGTAEFTTNTVAELLTSRYDVSAEQAAADASALLNTWQQFGLIDID